MVFPKARLGVAAALFLGWIGYLAYLVAMTRDPVVLSRPQLAVADLVLLADVAEKAGRPAPTLTIAKVAWGTATDEALQKGAHLGVEGLADCAAPQGWRGAGLYIVPLSRRKVESRFSYEVTPLPMSPGYSPQYRTVELFQMGPDKIKVAQLLAKLGGHAGDDPVPGLRLHNVPWQTFEELKDQLKTAKAGVRITEGESRIYKATADALEQLDEWQRAR